MPPETRHIANPKVYIYQLPNEILYLIFTFLFDLFEDDNVWVPIQPDNVEVRVHPILNLRWVCVWFRKVATRHTLWLEDSMDIPVSLLNYGVLDKTTVLYDGFLKTFLYDADLRSSLRERSTWNLSSTEDFSALLANGPDLYAKTQNLTFVQLETIPVRRLASFTGLTSLSISGLTSLDLDAIVMACPMLKKFQVRGIDAFTGSLSPLRTITNLDIQLDECSPRIAKTFPFLWLLPISSVHCLTHVTLSIPEVSILYYSSSPVLNPLEPFVNVSDLTTIVNPHFDPALLELIARAALPISTLKLLAFADWDDPINSQRDALLNMLCGPSFTNLKNFTLEGDMFQDDIVNLRVPVTLCSLHYLEYLDLVAFPMPSAWWTEFEKMRSLEFLRFWIDPKKYDIYEWPTEEIIAGGKRMCVSIFGNRDRRIHVIVNEWGVQSGEKETLIDDWFRGCPWLFGKAIY